MDEEGQIRVKESDPLIVLPFFCQAYAGDTKVSNSWYRKMLEILPLLEMFRGAPV